jgi:hypothetical protein
VAVPEKEDAQVTTMLWVDVFPVVVIWPPTYVFSVGVTDQLKDVALEAEAVKEVVAWLPWQKLSAAGDNVSPLTPGLKVSAMVVVRETPQASVPTRV